MISAWHLVWILPVVFTAGFCVAGLFVVSKDPPDSDSVKSHMMENVRKGRVL